MCCLYLCFFNVALGEKRTEIRYENDLKPQEEILQEVQKTRQSLLNKVAGIPEPKQKDPRSKFYLGLSAGMTYNPRGEIGYIIGTEAGYNFVVQKDNSLRIFLFFIDLFILVFCAEKSEKFRSRTRSRRIKPNIFKARFFTFYFFDNF